MQYHYRRALKRRKYSKDSIKSPVEICVGGDRQINWKENDN